MKGSSHYEFEWDATKAASNIAKHGISFEEAVRVFDDPGLLETFDADSDDGEVRWLVTAFSGLRLLTVVYTERNDIIRIISARKATRREQRDYSNQN